MSFPYDGEFESPVDLAKGLSLKTAASRVGDKASTLLWGIAAPITCFALDWAMGLSDFLGPPLVLYKLYRVFCFGLIGLELLALLIWIFFGSKQRIEAAFLSGVLLMGGIAAATVGIILLPYSLAGLIVGIGLIGFVPFITAATFVRCGIAAYRCAIRQKSSLALRGLVLLGMILVIGLPAASQACVSLSLRSAIQDIAQGNESALEKFNFWYYFASEPNYYVDNPDHFESLNPIVQAYFHESDPTRRVRLAKAYQSLTGKRLDVTSIH